ncbi:MAG: hypothetical protein GF388_11650 [Candidatus Aegiribacteria sp.]|nr:hypothetical protein [Candidatus Aegiribacteria sp.]
MDTVLGATSGDSLILNSIEQDFTVFLSGNASLRISASDSTDTWYSLKLDIPDDIKRVTITCHVKGNGLQRVGNQFDNCYLGFWYNGANGERSFKFEPIPRGTFDWTELSLSLNTEIQPAETIKFSIFSSISGTLWLDDLSFTYDDDCDAIPEDTVRGPLADYIGDLYSPATFMKIPSPSEGDCPDSISAAELSEDIELLKYLIEYGYSGYTYWRNNGVDFDSAFDSLEALALSGDSLAVKDFEQLIADLLSGIQDGHTAVKGHETHRFIDRYNPYFTNVIVELSQGEEEDSILHEGYVVIQSRCDSVKPGMIYTGSEDRLFRTLSRKGSEQYQLGVFSNEEINEASFPFNTEPGSGDGVSNVDTLKLPLHECNLTARTDDSREGIYYRTQVDGIEQIRVRSFSGEYYDALAGFVSAGDTLASTERFIVDLTGNTGGNSNYPMRFVRSLNGVAQWRVSVAVLCSPATIGSIASIPITEDSPENWVEYVRSAQNTLELLRDHPVRNWFTFNDSLPPRQMGSYTGQAVFLFDRETASSGEAFLDYSLSIPGAVHIGENSAGIGTFGDIRNYWLPNSHIRITLPCKLFITPGFEEGVGYLPDYWLDSPEPIQEITEWMNDPESYQYELPDPE